MKHDKILSKFLNNKIIINSSGKVGLSSKINTFNLLNKVVEKAKQEIMAEEDAEIFRLLDEI
jgi:hypothetical protein